MPLTTTTSVDTLSFDGVRTLFPELTFTDLADVAEPGPFVYLLLTPRGGVLYIGKSDAQHKAAAARAMQYLTWNVRYQQRKADVGRPDPAESAMTGSLDLTAFSPIVRAFARYSAVVKVATVGHTGEPARVWEARLQAANGTLTTVESIIGGTAWEANPGTLRGDGYQWVAARITQLREDGAA